MDRSGKVLVKKIIIDFVCLAIGKMIHVFL